MTSTFDPFRDVPFVVACYECDCDSPDSYEQAMAEGWTQIEYAPEGFSSNFFGYCPAHGLTEAEFRQQQPDAELPGENPP